MSPAIKQAIAEKLLLAFFVKRHKEAILASLTRLSTRKLQDVIGFAGGFTDEVYTALIKVSQISDQQRRVTDVIEADYKNYVLMRGDIYKVDRILNRFENRVTINGAVFRPGQYELQKA